jgi:hypothetical protein
LGHRDRAQLHAAAECQQLLNDTLGERGKPPARYPSGQTVRCLPARRDSSRFVYTDQSAGRYILVVVPRWSGNKRTADGVLGADDASVV